MAMTSHVHVHVHVHVQVQVHVHVQIYVHLLLMYMTMYMNMYISAIFPQTPLFQPMLLKSQELLIMIKIVFHFLC